MANFPVVIGEQKAYTRKNWFPNFLAGDPTARVKLAGNTRSVACQILDQQPQEGHQPELSFWKGLFYVAQKVDFLDGKGPVWVLFNKGSQAKFVGAKVDNVATQCWNKVKDEDGQVVYDQLSEEERAYLTHDVLNEIQARYATKDIKEVGKKIEVAKEIIKTLKEFFLSGKNRVEDMSNQENPRKEAIAKKDEFVQFAKFAKEIRRPMWVNEIISGSNPSLWQAICSSFFSLQKPVPDDSSQILACIQKYSPSLTEPDIQEILKYVAENREKHLMNCWQLEIPYSQVCPKDSKLKRQLLFGKDGSVIIKFNRQGTNITLSGEKDTIIGKGSYTKVKTGYDLTRASCVAIATVVQKNPSLKKDAGYYPTLTGYELAHQHLGNKEGIVPIRGVAEQKSKYHETSSYSSFPRHKVMVVMDLQSGDLFDALQKNNYSLEKRRQQGLDLLKGLCAMHEAKIVHQDLKPANCLITEDGNLLIADFGVSVKQGLQKCAGTIGYMAPTQREIQGTTSDMKNDVWSAGMILWELVTEDVTPYFKYLSPKVAFEEQASINPKSDEWMLETGTTKETLRQTPSSDAKMALLIADMLHPKNSERVNAVEALSRYNSLLSNLANAT